MHAHNDLLATRSKAAQDDKTSTGLRDASVLFVGADPDDGQHINWLLSNIEAPHFIVSAVASIDHVQTDEARHAYDVVLLSLPGSEDADLDELRTVRARLKGLPVVVLLEDGNDGAGYRAIRAGAQDHLTRNRLNPAAIARTLVNAIERHRLQGSQGTSPLLQSATDVLNRLPLGVLLVNNEGRALFLNKKARATLQTGDGLSIDRAGVLRATRPADAKALSELVSRTLSASPTEAEQDDCVLSLERDVSDTPLQIMVAPIGSGVSGQGAVIFISDPNDPVTVSASALARLYGLTPAEARLAQGMANGMQLDDMAATWNVSMHTVRSQLRQIFRKTDTSRQSELVKLILTSPATIR